MNNDYMTSNDRLIFLQSKHDRTDGAFLVVTGCLAIVLVAQLVIWFGR
jgi:hypothetical protein